VDRFDSLLGWKMVDADLCLEAEFRRGRTVSQGCNVPLTVVLLASAIAAVTDVWKFKVHNTLTLPLLLAGFLYHGMVGGVSQLAASMGGAVFGFTILILFYVMGGMGAGDVKLMAAIGAWLGMPLTLCVFVASALTMGIYAVVLVVMYGTIRETWVKLQIVWHRLATIGRHLGTEEGLVSEVKVIDRRRLIPFAPMVAVGLVALLVWVFLSRAQ
jgi:prepilin peptidase CpaA